MPRNRIELNRPLKRANKQQVKANKGHASSPFLESDPVQLNFSVVLILHVTFVACGVAWLLALAFLNPAIRSEFEAWFGKATTSTQTSVRGIQLYFALALYAAPLCFAVVLAVIHKIFNFLVSRTRLEDEDEAFLMEKPKAD